MPAGSPMCSTPAPSSPFPALHGSRPALDRRSFSCSASTRRPTRAAGSPSHRQQPHQSCRERSLDQIQQGTAGENASVLYQTAFSGRTEMGLAGDDDIIQGERGWLGLAVSAQDRSPLRIGAFSAERAHAKHKPRQPRQFRRQSALRQRYGQPRCRGLWHDRWKAGASGCTYTFTTTGLDTASALTFAKTTIEFQTGWFPLFSTRRGPARCLTNAQIASIRDFFVHALFTNPSQGSSRADDRERRTRQGHCVQVCKRNSPSTSAVTDKASAPLGIDLNTASIPFWQ